MDNDLKGVHVGIDPAEPGADRTVFAVHPAQAEALLDMGVPPDRLEEVADSLR